jgi:serine/threonine protein kinase
MVLHTSLQECIVFHEKFMKNTRSAGTSVTGCSNLSDKNMSSSTLESKFELLKLLGHGSFGKVYLAVPRGKAADLVVVKVMQCQTRDAVIEALSEVVMMRMCRSPFIVEMIGAPFQHDLTVCCAMELCDLGDMSFLIADARSEQRPFAESVSFASILDSNINCSKHSIQTCLKT